MRTAIVQYFINPYKYSEPEYHNLETLQQLVGMSERSFRSYCDKHDIHYHKISKPRLHYRHPAFERFDLWLNDEWWNKYDQICYVDCDVFALPYAPNIFDEYPQDTFKYCYYEKYRNSKITQLRKKHKKTLLGVFNPRTIRDKFFQTGVFVLTKNTAKHMRDWIKLYKKLDHTDTEILNWAVLQSKVPTTEMDKKWNYKNAQMLNNPEVYFFHQWGKKKKSSIGNITSWLNKNGIL